MLAPSVLFVLDRAFKRGWRGPAVLAALGPGFTANFWRLRRQMVDGIIGPGTWLVVFLLAQRLAELALARWNTACLRRLGGVEFGAKHYPFMVALNAFWLLALWLAGHSRPIDPVWLAVFAVLQIGRIWVIASLGRRWTTRVIALPGVAPVTGGPFRFIKHPNYLIVALEIAVVPLALGLPGLALGFSLANAAVLIHRIRVENEALAWALQPKTPSETLTTSTLANGQPRR